MKCGSILQLLLVEKIDILWTVEFKIFHTKFPFLSERFLEKGTF